jgi:hypothetical protein
LGYGEVARLVAKGFDLAFGSDFITTEKSLTVYQMAKHAKEFLKNDHDGRAENEIMRQLQLKLLIL